MGKLEGRVALITGASGGIGSAVAKRFVKEGANVILVSRAIDHLNPLYEEIGKLKEFREGSVKLIQLDLLDFENVKLLPGMIENLKLSESRALDILVACTGMLGKLTPIGDSAVEEFHNVMDTNFNANWYLLKSLDQILKKSNAGRVIFVTSEVTLSPSSYPYWIPYAASKAALEIMVKIYASETKHAKLCVNALYPNGPVGSSIYEQAFPGKEISELTLPDELTDKFVECASENYSASGEVLPLN
ncbi:SDR family NAD(P)-dependent oxidoreductase [Wolbachia endosymbiont of Ctenocephalides felis wCfeT]|uniref:SDR family NAD(P)-dependent oxidoreductase n=1 Tax=Wolbachia endosymbiont of Ctenocephalides felis wCfeT TaxID=2732593 RepID=UPI001447B3F4|nr:SDR family oxidoreductase [Wolbachia endosymbiont of Ctenocephalides felis wCfeT]